MPSSRPGAPVEAGIINAWLRRKLRWHSRSCSPVAVARNRIALRVSRKSGAGIAAPHWPPGALVVVTGASIKPSAGFELELADRETSLRAILRSSPAPTPGAPTPKASVSLPVAGATFTMHWVPGELQIRFAPDQQWLKLPL